MTAPWRAYQLQVADAFRSLGCTVAVEKEVTGARGVHSVDVLATITVAGIRVTWVVECKFWTAAIPKEKVLALSQLAADIGADRAFLVSESGFQSGAIRASQHTNVILTSRQDLLDNAREHVERRRLQALAERAHRLQNRLHDLFILDDYSPGPMPGIGRAEMIDLLAGVFELRILALPKAQADDFPIQLGRERIQDRPGFLAFASLRLVELEVHARAAKDAADSNTRTARSKLDELTLAIRGFLGAAEVARDSAGHAAALTLMKLIGLSA